MERLDDLLGLIRRRLAWRAVVRETAGTAVVVGAAALVVALVAPGAPRWVPWVALPLGPLLGLWRARRHAPSEEALVLHVDRALAADEAIVTAWELGDAAPPLLRRTVAHAAALVRAADPRDVRPRLHGERLALVPLAGVFFAAAGAVPVPPEVPGGGEERPDRVRVADAEALRRIERLPEEARDARQRQALEEAAREARALRRALARGIERRDALERLASVERAVREGGRRPTAAERRAREAASEALAPERAMRRALETRDPAAFDRAVERAAARREAADRARARRALRDAAAAARAEGDGDLADSLLARERLLERRAEQAALARELAEALPELAGARLRRQLERLSRDGDGGGLARETVDAMREAWSRLTPEERQRLADALQRAEAADNREARARAEGEGRAMSADEMERRLRAALDDLDRLRARVGGAGGGGIPVAGGRGGGANGAGHGAAGRGAGRGGGAGRGDGAGAGGTGGSGSGGGDGRTGAVDATDGPLARVRPRVGPGLPAETSFEWVDPEGAPLPEGVPDGEASGEAAAGRPGAIERAPIPQDYREHVRTYFGGAEGE
jgi:hypothetical protein